jgi:hypothetical protein
MPKLANPAASLAISLLLVGCTGAIGDGSSGGPGSGSPGGPGAGPGNGSGPGGSGSGGGSGPGGSGPGGGVKNPPPPANSEPGVNHVRRLTQLEYRNTLRDLLNVDVQGLELAGDQQAGNSGYTTGAAITTSTDARKLLDGTERLVGSAMTNLGGQVPCIKDAAAAEPCARDFIVQFGRRAFRRPLVDEEVTRWLALYNAQRDAATGANFADAIRGVATALLVSPNFLYRRELAPGAAIKDGNFVRFNSYEMASRLSYSFWASMPDNRLFDLAAADTLTSVPTIQQEARRLLADPKAKDLYADFAAQWLNLAPVASALKATALNFTPEVAKAMLAESGAFFADLFMGPNTNGRLDTLFSSNKTFVDSTLAALYGVQGVTGNAMSQVTLDPKQRAGFFTQLTFLTMHGDSEGSFPTRRGAEIVRRVLCHEIDIPPDGVVPDIKPPSPGVTTRQRFSEHSNMPCAACHVLFDPIGFAFEHYDGIGRYRTTDNMQPVDASGTLQLGGKTVRFKDAVELMPQLAQSEEVQACVATQWTRYLLRREETQGDMPSLQGVQKAFRDSSLDLREMLVSIVTSDAFMRRTPAAGEVLP